jgi:hypothetical protein
MKKFFGIAILIVFVLSVMGSVSPEINSFVKNLTGDKKYASSSLLPAPPELPTDGNLATK